MSGGYFNYIDQAADYIISEELQCDIETLQRLKQKGDMTPEREIRLMSALELKSASRIIFDWLHQYDFAASDDTRFEDLPALTDEHKRKLREVLVHE